MNELDTIQEIKERLVRIEILLEKNTENWDEKLSVANHRIDDLEKNNTWLWRTIVGSLIGSAIALLLKLK